MSVRNDSEVEAKPVEGAQKTYIKRLICREHGAPNFEMRKFILKPGGRIPKHLHPDMEHIQYVLKGRYKLGIGEEVYDVKPGDAVLIPANTPHWYENPGPQEAEFICIIPMRETPATIRLE